MSGIQHYSVNMSYALFLDDIRLPHWIYEKTYEWFWVVVKNKNEFVDTINKHGIPKVISLDNDLGLTPTGEIHEDGYACLNWLIDNDIYVENIIIHSDNVVANEQMYGKACNWQKHLISEGLLTYGKVLKRPALKNLRKEYLDNLQNF